MNANEREMDLDGTQCYYLNGKLHREDGPALVIPYVKKAWYLNGKLHRIDGPAEEWDWGTKYWYLNGELHREDGPAIEYADGKKRWFLNGKEYTKNKFNIVTHKNTIENKAVTEKDKTMNNRFKFRVWDKLAKRMIYPHNDNQQHFIIDLNGRFHNLQNGSGGDDYVIQQYTGLTDNTDIPIYEGDIIHLKFGELNANLVVKWDKYMGLKYHNGGWTSLVHVDTHGEVIGNIFEHSELLN